MRRRPITFDEKVDARFTRGPRSQCWLWQGSLKEGRPAIGLRHVLRYIYEREIAPIPPGMVLWRTDHTELCRHVATACVHVRCVNPYHVRLIPSKGGLYEREEHHDLESSERSAIYKRRVRQNAREADDEGETDGSAGRQEGVDGDGDEGGGA